MKKRNYILITLVVFIIALIVCGGYVVGHYSADDYYIMHIGYNQYSIVNNLKEGRPIMCLLDQLANIISLNYDVFIILTVVIAIFISSINVVILFDIIVKCKNITSKYLKMALLIALYVTVFNFMYIENLYFVESIVMALSLLFYTISAKNLMNNNLTKTIVLSLAATLCYNGFLCYFITIVALLSLLEDDKDFKILLKRIIQAGLILIFAIILNLLQIKITCVIFDLNSTRTGSLSAIFKNMLYIIQNLPSIIINTAQLFPKYLYLLFVLIMFLFYVILAKQNKDKSILINYCLILFISIASNFCVSLVSLSSFGTGRLLYGVGMTIGILFIYILTDEHFEGQRKVFKDTLIVILIIYFILILLNYVYIIKQHKIVNDAEKQEVLQMYEYIAKYQQEKNMNINKIAFIYKVDEYNGIKAHYYVIKNTSGITKRATALNWSCTGVINFYSGLNLEQTECTSEMFETYNSSNEKFLNEYLIYENILICPIYDW